MLSRFPRLPLCRARSDPTQTIRQTFDAYASQSCACLQAELAKVQCALTAVSAEQQNAASDNAFGVVLTRAPMSSTFAGDKNGKVAVAKRKVQAIGNALKSEVYPGI
jgi:hypothetical protein